MLFGQVTSTLSAEGVGVREPQVGVVRMLLQGRVQNTQCGTERRRIVAVGSCQDACDEADKGGHGGRVANKRRPAWLEVRGGVQGGTALVLGERAL